MSVAHIDPLSDARWLAFLEQAPGASIFHHPAWLKILADTYNFSPVCLVATEAQQIVGLLPLMEVRSWLTGKRGVCLPFSDSCGPVVSSDSALAAILQTCETLRQERRWKYVEIRNLVLAQGFKTSARYKSHRTALCADPEALFKTLNQQSRRKVRKAEKAGVVVTRRVDEEALAAFIRLNAQTRKKHGVPPQPDTFFLNMWRDMLSNGLGFIGTATIDDRIVSTAVFLHWKDKLVYKYGASDGAALDAAANYAVMWNAMQWGCEHGFLDFDLGRSDLAGEGLLQFKSGWGSRESELCYFRQGPHIKDETEGSTSMLARLKPLVSNTPLPILKIVGRSLYAHIG